MYKIIGTDQKEYGPVSSDQIHKWIAQGRINAQTKMQSEGGDWKSLGEFPEFATSLGSIVPPLPRTTPNPVPDSALPPKTSGLAIASLVLGILGILTCGITAIVGLIFGIIAMIRVRKSNGALGGHGLALAGTIVSAVFLMLLLPAAMLMPAIAKAKQRAVTILCINNMKQLDMAARMYAANHQDHFPSAQSWCDDLKQYLGGNTRVYRCPAADLGDRCDYAFNSKLSGMDTKKVNPQTVLFFETDSGWNASGGPELMRNPSRHGRTFAVAFADGHIEQLTSAGLANLRWDP
jgi:prepilin-type processing-associated H-X9-DG protein